MGIDTIIDGEIDEPSFREAVIDFLLTICKIDTSMSSDSEAMEKRETRLFELIGEKLKDLSFPNSKIQMKAISRCITEHPAFTPIHYMNNPRDAATAYRDRCNLLYLLENPPSERGRGTAVNVHIDTVPPHIPPRRRDDLIYGRGSADDKGNIAALIGALQIIRKLCVTDRVTLRNPLSIMFVIDEEMGGNGSLDLALNRELKTRYESLMVLECTDNRIHPANRGAVFFECRLQEGKRKKENRDRGGPILEALLFAIGSVLVEGESIKNESSHPLFPHRPVQTCTGILGPFGEHPSSICGMVRCRLTINTHDGDGVQVGIEEVIQRGIDRYVEQYGDKTRIMDKVTGRRKLDRHYECSLLGTGCLGLTVYGCSGHMGSLPDNDAAITKLAFIAEALIREKQGGTLDFRIELDGHTGSDSIIFEGAQGFLPTHHLDEVTARIREAFFRGLQEYLNLFGYDSERIKGTISFDKLHNEAYESDPESPSVKSALRAAELSGLLQRSLPLRGWDVSCDARLFAKEYPDMPVLTFGAGKLKHAHSEEERLYLSELFNTIKCVVLYLLLETGSLD
jgi:acetylornithine deacetylase/succinyl-diaminopimelate desuccinylase-like protein